MLMRQRFTSSCRRSTLLPLPVGPYDRHERRQDEPEPVLVELVESALECLNRPRVREYRRWSRFRRSTSAAPTRGVRNTAVEWPVKPPAFLIA